MYIEEIRKFSYGSDFIQCTQLTSSSTVGYCFKIKNEYPIADILAYGYELDTSCIYILVLLYDYIVNENTVKSRTESYITQRVNSNLNDIYTNYYRDLEECSDRINSVESLTEINLNQNNQNERDYGSNIDGSSYFLTNRYIAFVVKRNSYNSDYYYYYKRLIYNIELYDDECNPTIKIKSLNNTLSAVFLSDKFRYKEMTEDKKLEFKYYNC